MSADAGHRGQLTPSRFQNGALVLASVLCNLGIFTLSWDRIGNLSAGSFNVKISIIAFLVSLALTVLGGHRLGQIVVPRLVLYLSLAMLLVLVVASVLADDQRTALLGVVTVVLGALVPALAVVANSRIAGQFQEMLKWFVWGAVVACIFGLYQLLAFYTGLPQLIEYEGVSGGLGRISSFSYEPAYLGYFLVVVLVVALARFRSTRWPWGYVQIGLVLVTLLLLNSRAVFLTLPLLLILVRPLASGLATFRQMWITAAAAVGAFLLVCVTVPSIPATLGAQFLSIFNPQEASSNAPRLELYTAAVQVAAKYPIFGVGPSNFGIHIAELNYAQYEGVSLNKMVVNNIWLQSLMDGGAVLAIVQAALVVVAIVTIYFSKNVVARILMAGWIAVILVGGMVVSNFYDAKMWVTLALAIAALQLGALRPETNARRGTKDFTYVPIVPVIDITFPRTIRAKGVKIAPGTAPARPETEG